MLHSAQLTLTLVQHLILKSPDGNRGASFAVLSGPPRSPSGGAVEVIKGMAVKSRVVVEGITVEEVILGMAVNVAKVGMAVEGEDEGMAVEEVMVEMMEVVTVELCPC